MTNYWGWLFLLFIPVLVFSATPDSSLRFRLFRLFFAIVLGYGALNMMLHLSQAVEREAYDACQSQFEDGYRVMHEECGNPFIGNGAQRITYLSFGWVLAAIYIGIWEWYWRVKHRLRIKEMGKAFKGRWLSNILISFTLFGLIIYPVCSLISFFILYLLHR